MQKILIVEDDLDIQEMIQFFLEDQNYQVCVADDVTFPMLYFCQFGNGK